MFNWVLNTLLFTQSLTPCLFTIQVLIVESTLKHIKSARSKIVGNAVFEIEFATQRGLILRYYFQFTTIKVIVPRYGMTRTKYSDQRTPSNKNGIKSKLAPIPLCSTPRGMRKISRTPVSVLLLTQILNLYLPLVLPELFPPQKCLRWWKH